MTYVMKDLWMMGFGLLILCLCACTGANYVTRDEARTYMGTSPNARDHSKNFGALAVYNPKEETADPKVYFLKRDGSRYMMETEMFNGEPVADFEKAYWSFGADSKKRTVGLRWRFTY